MWVFNLHVNGKYLFISIYLPVFQVCDGIAETLIVQANSLKQTIPAIQSEAAQPR
jgi:hypothetical protein